MPFDTPIWIGSPTDVRTDVQAVTALENVNDLEFSTTTGIMRVSRERWKKAQEYERLTWLEIATGAKTDRNDEHANYFEQYIALPTGLGDVLEVGCGPFTQLATILGKGHAASSITLLDPLIDKYVLHPNCPYADGRLCQYDATLLCHGLEELQEIRRFDTLISINVLEHVMDAGLALDRMIMALRPGGILVFHDNSWEDTDPSKLYDVGHPIRLYTETLVDFFGKFDMMFRYSHKHDGGWSYYFVGRLI